MITGTWQVIVTANAGDADACLVRFGGPGRPGGGPGGGGGGAAGYWLTKEHTLYAEEERQVAYRRCGECIGVAGKACEAEGSRSTRCTPRRSDGRGVAEEGGQRGGGEEGGSRESRVIPSLSSKVLSFMQ